jgi:hypothetical protein
MPGEDETAPTPERVDSVDREPLQPSPALPPLERSMLEGTSPITSTQELARAGGPRAVAYESLLPDDVVRPPALAPLPARSLLELGLQPALDQADAPSLRTVEARPVGLDLVLGPPPLPPLTDEAR